MRMALGHACGGDSAELRLLAKLLDVARPAIAHSRSQSADELIHEIAQRPAVWHAPFDALGDELAALLDAGLSVAIAGAGDHRAHAAHAAIGLISTPLVNDCFARRFIEPRKEAAHHDRRRPGGDRLGDVAGMADPAIRNHRHARRLRDADGIEDRSHLWHTDTADDSRRAD